MGAPAPAGQPVAARHRRGPRRPSDACCNPGTPPLFCAPPAVPGDSSRLNSAASEATKHPHAFRRRRDASHPKQPYRRRLYKNATRGAARRRPRQPVALSYAGRSSGAVPKRIGRPCARDLPAPPPLPWNTSPSAASAAAATSISARLMSRVASRLIVRRGALLCCSSSFRRGVAQDARDGLVARSSDAQGVFPGKRRAGAPW